MRTPLGGEGKERDRGEEGGRGTKGAHTRKPRRRTKGVERGGGGSPPRRTEGRKKAWRFAFLWSQRLDFIWRCRPADRPIACLNGRRRPRPFTPSSMHPPAPLDALSLALRFSRIARLASIHPPLPRRYPVCSLSVGRGCRAALYTLINFIISHYHRRMRARRLSYSCWIDSCQGVRCNFLVGVGNYIIALVKERTCS